MRKLPTVTCDALPMWYSRGFVAGFRRGDHVSPALSLWASTHHTAPPFAVWLTAQPKELRVFQAGYDAGLAAQVAQPRRKAEARKHKLLVKKCERSGAFARFLWRDF